MLNHKLKDKIVYFILITSRGDAFSLRFFYKLLYVFFAWIIFSYLKKLKFIISIYTGGSFAKGDFIPGLSDIDFAFILKDKNFSNNEQRLRRLYSFFSKIIPVLESERYIIVINIKDVTRFFEINIPKLIVAYQLLEEKKHWKKIYGEDLLKETGVIQPRFKPYAYFEKLNLIWRKFYAANNEAKVYKRDHIFCNITRDLLKLYVKNSDNDIENINHCLNNADCDVINKLENIRKDNFLKRLDNQDYKKLEQIFFKIGFYTANKFVDRLRGQSASLGKNSRFRCRFTDLPIHALNILNIESLKEGIGENFNIACLSSVLYEVDAICVFINTSVDDLPMLLDLVRKIKLNDHYVQRIWLYAVLAGSDIAVSLDIYTDKHSDKFFLTPFHDPFMFQVYNKENDIKDFDLTYLRLFLEYELSGFVDLFKNGDIYKLCDTYLYQNTLKIYQFNLLSRLLYRNELIELPMTSKDIIDSADRFSKDDRGFLKDSYCEYLKIFKGERHSLRKYRKHIIDFCLRVSRGLYGCNG